MFAINWEFKSDYSFPVPRWNFNEDLLKVEKQSVLKRKNDMQEFMCV